MSTCYEVGDIAVIAAAFATLDGTPTDPSELSLAVLLPDGSEVVSVYGVDSALVRDSLGAYHLNYLFTQAARHWYRWAATGAVTAADEGFVDVKLTQFAVS